MPIDMSRLQVPTLDEIFGTLQDAEEKVATSIFSEMVTEGKREFFCADGVANMSAWLTSVHLQCIAVLRQRGFMISETVPDLDGWYWNILNPYEIKKPFPAERD